MGDERIIRVIETEMQMHFSNIRMMAQFVETNAYLNLNCSREHRGVRFLVVCMFQTTPYRKYAITITIFNLIQIFLSANQIFHRFSFNMSILMQYSGNINENVSRST